MQAQFRSYGFAAAELMNAPKASRKTAKSTWVHNSRKSPMQQQLLLKTDSNRYGECRTSLINVANEGAGTPTDPEAATKTHSQAIWMVQQIYKPFIYVWRSCYFTRGGSY